MDLAWIQHDHKLLVVGSRTLTDLYLYSFYLEKFEEKEVMRSLA